MVHLVSSSRESVDRGSSPPGSSRRAGGYSPVLRLTADEMSLPLFPCPKKFTFWDTTLLPRGTFWVRVPRRPARGRPKAVFLLLACCTQEEDAGPAAHRCASSCVQQASRRSFAACSPLEPRAGLPSVPMSKIVYFLGHAFSLEAAPKYPRQKTGECPPARLLLPGGLGTPIDSPVIATHPRNALPEQGWQELMLLERQAHSPPWNRPNPWASISDMIRMPAPRTSTCWVLRRLKLPTRQTRRYPTARLKRPHRTLTIAEDKPSPGGDAKGLWKACPEIPLPRWGRLFARNAPPKK